jgi:hypothetical protein
VNYLILLLLLLQVRAFLCDPRSGPTEPPTP